MAASNKSIGLQITLALFAMLAVIGWVAFYMQFRELGDNRAQYVKAGEDLRTEQTLTREQDDQIQFLKAKIGHNEPSVGHDQPDATTTVAYAIQQDIQSVATAHGYTGTDLSDVIKHLLQQLGDRGTEIGTKDTEITRNTTTISTMQTNQVTELQKHRDAVDAAERQRDDTQRASEEQRKALQAQIEEMRGDLTDLRVEYDDAKAAWTGERKKLTTEMAQWEGQVDFLRDKLKNLTKVSFERPDGLVRWVDNSAGLVWVNIGAQDGLRIRTTFSVYKKSHHGVGHGADAEDIKGQLEITRIIDANTAEARVLDDDIYDPIAKGDPIYTPLWSPGRVEKFAIIGIIDLDQDGIEDREQFHELVQDAGAKINHEVLDDGSRIRYPTYPGAWEPWEEGGPELDSDTKYVIKANIPDVALAALEEEKEKRLKISAQLKTMRDEARRLGIEEINLNDFLSYIGYRPQQRIYIPGVVDRPFNLRSGAHSVTTSETIGDRSSSGQVSKKFGTGRRLKPGASSGQTSGKFGGSYGR
jgi:hypothetical protein